MKAFKYFIIFWLCFNTIKSQDYASLQKTLDGGYYKLVSDILYFKTYGEYNNDTIRFCIYGKVDTIMATNYLIFKNHTVINTTVQNAGYNEYSITCISNSIFPTGNYVLEVINEKKEKKYLRFKK